MHTIPCTDEHWRGKGEEDEGGRKRDIKLRVEGVGEGRERERKRGGREGGEKSGPFDGAFVGSRGARRFATKIAPFASQSSPVICCEFINATVGVWHCSFVTPQYRGSKLLDNSPEILEVRASK